jgi:hypothetical protein
MQSVMPEILGPNLKDLALHKYARRVFLHLLAPLSVRYFPPHVVSLLQPPRVPTPEEEAAAKVKADAFKAEFAEPSGEQPKIEGLEVVEIERDLEELDDRAVEEEAVTVVEVAGNGSKEGASKGGVKEEVGEEGKKKRKRGGMSIAEKKKKADKEFVDNGPMVGPSKKDPALRRLELLKGSGLAKVGDWKKGGMSAMPSSRRPF